MLKLLLPPFDGNEVPCGAWQTVSGMGSNGLHLDQCCGTAGKHTILWGELLKGSSLHIVQPRSLLLPTWSDVPPACARSGLEASSHT